MNTGFDGIAVKEDEKYDLSLFARTPDGKGGGKAVVRLVDPQGKTVAETSVSLSSKNWKKREAVLKATATVAQARLVIIPRSAGRYALDMISLFPQKTFKGRKNGLRADLAQAIATSVCVSSASLADVWLMETGWTTSIIGKKPSVRWKPASRS